MIIGYWFGEMLGYGDGRTAAVGVTHEVGGPSVPCERGLHASRHPFDALAYAQSPVLWMVELGGEVVEWSDKAAATKRTYLKRLDATELLRAFARWCALQVIDEWECPPIVREWLETGREELRSAANSAARSAENSAARSAENSAAYFAAYSAARSAAHFAANSAAYSAALSAQAAKLLEMVTEAFESQGEKP